jgi:hypothetical protein
MATLTFKKAQLTDMLVRLLRIVTAAPVTVL